MYILRHLFRTNKAFTNNGYAKVYENFAAKFSFYLCGLALQTTAAYKEVDDILKKGSSGSYGHKSANLQNGRDLLAKFRLCI